MKIEAKMSAIPTKEIVEYNPLFCLKNTNLKVEKSAPPIISIFAVAMIASTTDIIMSAIPVNIRIIFVRDILCLKLLC